MEKFWKKVIKQENGCWLWTSSKTKGGYGTMRSPETNSRIYAHRYSFKMAGYGLPPGLTIDHLCRIRACVNPEHMEAVTLSENIKRSLKYRENNPNYRNKFKTHCIKGHEFTNENTYRPPKKPHTRQCKTCNIIRVTLFNQKKRLVLNSKHN